MFKLFLFSFLLIWQIIRERFVIQEARTGYVAKNELSTKAKLGLVSKLI